MYLAGSLSQYLKGFFWCNSMEDDVRCWAIIGSEPLQFPKRLQKGKIKCFPPGLRFLIIRTSPVAWRAIIYLFFSFVLDLIALLSLFVTLNKHNVVVILGNSSSDILFKKCFWKLNLENLKVVLYWGGVLWKGEERKLLNNCVDTKFNAK